MQHAFGDDGFGADTAFGKGDVGRDFRIEIMAYHNHIKEFGDRVLAAGQCRIGRAWQDVILAHHFQQIRRVTAACAFAVIGVDGAPVEGCDGVLDIAGFVQRIRMDGHRHVIFIGNRKAGANCSRRGAIVFMDLETGGTCFQLLDQRRNAGGISLALNAKVDRQALDGAQHHFEIPRPVGRGHAVCAVNRPDAAAPERGDAVRESGLHLLRRDIVNMGIHAARGEDKVLARYGVG